MMSGGMSCAFYGLHFASHQKINMQNSCNTKSRFMQRTLLPLNRHLSYLVQAESRASLQNSTDSKTSGVV